jgi:cytochrome P450
MIFLARNPSHVKQLTDAPDRIDRGVEELFRPFAMVTEARMVAKDIERDGVHLKCGNVILVPTALAGLDPDMDKNPWEVDLKRRAPKQLTFGEGPHRCAAMHLARLEVIMPIEEWLRRIPAFHLKPATKPTYASGVIAAVENVQLEWQLP